MKKKGCFSKIFTVLCVLIIIAVCALYTAEYIAARNLSSRFTEFTLGNTSSNILKNGLFAENDGVIYYSNLRENSNVYALKPEEMELKKVVDNYMGYNINIMGDYMYYVSGLPGFIHMRNLETGSDRYLTLNRADNLIVTNEYMFYKYCNENNKYGRLYRTDLLGFHKKTIVDSVTEFIVDENVIYYISGSDGFLYKTDFSGENVQKLSDIAVGSISADGDYVFYTDNEEDKCNLYRVKPDGTDKELISEDRCWRILAAKRFVYYRNMNNGGKVYRIKADGTDREIAINDTTAVVNGMTENYFFYSLGDLSNKVYYMRHLETGEATELF
ncbi:MAG: DUF5050 domain-containing protein [Clostridiales bacterium]|nr:DUF5050 domain-containing protein [Clostridiales bacterium]